MKPSVAGQQRELDGLAEEVQSLQARLLEIQTALEVRCGAEGRPTTRAAEASGALQRLVWELERSRSAALLKGAAAGAEATLVLEVADEVPAVVEAVNIQRVSPQRSGILGGSIYDGNSEAYPRRSSGAGRFE